MKEVFWLVLVFTSSLASTMVVQAADWYDNISFKGSFRYRYEYTDDESKNADGTNKNADERHQHRLQARIGLDAKIHDTLNFNFTLASGQNNSPTSRNQTFSDVTRKDVWIDTAFVTWNPSSADNWKGLSIVLGKHLNPFWAAGRSDLIFDGDLTPEGGYVRYKNTWESFTLTSVLSGTWLKENSGGADSGHLGVQFVGGLKFLDNKLGIDLGVSYHNFGNVSSFATNYAVAAKADQDYDLLNIGLEVSYKFDFAPVSIYVDYVLNTGDESDDNETGFLVGFKIGEIKNARDWQFSYDFRKLESQAVISNLTDATFAGGGVGVSGHSIKASYAIYKPWTVGVVVLLGERGIDTLAEGDHTVVCLDTNYRF